MNINDFIAYALIGFAIIVFAFSPPKCEVTVHMRGNAPNIWEIHTDHTSLVLPPGPDANTELKELGEKKK